MSDKYHKYKNISLFILVFLLTTLLYFIFLGSPYFALVVSWASTNFKIYFILLTLLKVIGIVWPPLPGGILTLGSIPIIGWQYSYLADLIGSLVGSTVAFLIGKKYGQKLVEKIFGTNTVQKFSKVKIVKNKEFESIFVLRIVGGTVVEIICYGAGMLKVNYINFISATFLSHLLIGIPSFYFLDEVSSKESLIPNIIGIVVFVLILQKIKGRYFE